MKERGGTVDNIPHNNTTASAYFAELESKLKVCQDEPSGGVKGAQGFWCYPEMAVKALGVTLVEVDDTKQVVDRLSVNVSTFREIVRTRLSRTNAVALHKALSNQMSRTKLNATMQACINELNNIIEAAGKSEVLLAQKVVLNSDSPLNELLQAHGLGDFSIPAPEHLNVQTPAKKKGRTQTSVCRPIYRYMLALAYLRYQAATAACVHANPQAHQERSKRHVPPAKKRPRELDIVGPHAQGPLPFGAGHETDGLVHALDSVVSSEQCKEEAAQAASDAAEDLALQHERCSKHARTDAQPPRAVTALFKVLKEQTDQSGLLVQAAARSVENFQRLEKGVKLFADTLLSVQRLQRQILSRLTAVEGALRTDSIASGAASTATDGP